MDMYNNYQFQHFNVTMSKNSDENDIFGLVKKLRPTWNQSDIIIKRIVAGFLNQAYTCLHKEDLTSQEDGLFIRIHGKNGEAVERLLINREHEIRLLKELNKHKIGAPLLCTFNNGTVLKFIKGNMVRTDIHLGTLCKKTI